MSILVRPWCTLELSDLDLSNTMRGNVRLQPFEETQLRMKIYGIRGQFINTSYKTYVSMRSSKNVWEELQMSKDLYFQLTHEDTEASEGCATSVPQKTIPYFKTRVFQETFRAEESLISSNISIHSLRFDLEVSELLNTYVYVKDANGKKIVVAYTHKNQSHLAIDLTAFGIGVYEIWMNDTLLETVFATNQKIEANCKAIVQMDMDTIVTTLRQHNVPMFSIALATTNEYKSQELILQDQKIKALIAGKHGDIRYTTSKNRIRESKKSTLVNV